MSKKIRVLTDEDFSVVNTSAGELLACNIRGYFLVLFYSNKHDSCKAVFEAISQLVVPECSVGVMSVFRGSKVVKMSMGTRTELKRVPAVMMYVDGLPKAIYHIEEDAEPKVADFQRFVILIMEQFRTKNQQVVPRTGFVHEDKNKRRIKPDYSDGVPICSDGICYMTITDAYKKK
jgi:hypothetical protein